MIKALTAKVSHQLIAFYASLTGITALVIGYHHSLAFIFQQLQFLHKIYLNQTIQVFLIFNKMFLCIHANIQNTRVRKRNSVQICNTIKNQNKLLDF